MWNGLNSDPPVGASDCSDLTKPYDTVKRKPQRPPKARAAPIKVRAGPTTSFATAGCKKRGSRASRRPKSCSRCITNPVATEARAKASASLAALIAPRSGAMGEALQRTVKLGLFTVRLVSYLLTS